MSIQKTLIFTQAVTFVAFLIVFSGVGYTLFEIIKLLADKQLSLFAEHLLFLVVAILLSYGTLTYLLARIGYLKRQAEHNQSIETSPIELRPVDEQPVVTILIPSYREESQVVQKTLLSAALQEYPDLRVVLLIDDPPNPTTPSNQDSLDVARSLSETTLTRLRAPQIICTTAMNNYLVREKEKELDISFERNVLAQLYSQIASWYEEQAEEHLCIDYSDKFFINLTYEKPARRFRGKSEYWSRPPSKEPDLIDQDKQLIHYEYENLVHLFRVDTGYFERKRFVNLSQDFSKAANLNSYIGLIGKSCKEIASPDGLRISTTTEENADFIIPETEFILILDADTLISADYTRRMVDCMLQPGNESIAVAQSPYTSFPNAPHLLQRIAGAQTDIQYLIHVGLTYYDATFWVGANALVRISALREIADVRSERGYEITRFIQDRTSIEDTESSIDLIRRGWKLFNYPSRLAFSATPPDFGSLLIQRRRWANGGLLLLPKLMSYLKEHYSQGRTLVEVFMRAQYLLSLGPVSIALLFIILFSFNLTVRTSWVFLIAMVYFAFYMRDLSLNGYHRSDLIRVFSLNLLLVPINVGGMGLSIYQAVKGRKARFQRTPKIGGRTSVPPTYVIAEFTGLLALFLLSWQDLQSGYPVHGLFLLIHALFLLYAIKIFMGFRQSYGDLARLWEK